MSAIMPIYYLRRFKKKIIWFKTLRLNLIKIGHGDLKKMIDWYVSEYDINGIMGSERFRG